MGADFTDMGARLKAKSLDSKKYVGKTPFMPKLTSRQIQIEFFDRMILVEHVLPLVTVVHVDDLTSELPDGWEDLLEGRDFAALAKKHFGQTINKDATAMDLFGVLSSIVGNKGGLPLGVFVCYKIPVIHEVGEKGSLRHAGLGHTHSHWLYLASFDDAAMEEIIVDADARRKEQIKRLKAKAA
jgi:hypothetical protein